MSYKKYLILIFLKVFSKEEKNILKKIGANLRKKRIASDMSQAQVAFELNTSTRHYQRIEYGEINTGVVSIYKLAEILNTKPEELLLYNPEKKTF